MVRRITGDGAPGRWDVSDERITSLLSYSFDAGKGIGRVDVKTMGKITLEGLDTVQTLYLSTGNTGASGRFGVGAVSINATVRLAVNVTGSQADGSDLTLTEFVAVRVVLTNPRFDAVSMRVWTPPWCPGTRLSSGEIRRAPRLLLKR